MTPPSLEPLPAVTGPIAAKPKVAPPKVLEEVDNEEQLGPLYAVVCHDDPVTTMEFVVQILRGVFRVTHTRAVEVMLLVHHTGTAVVGRYPKETAERKVGRATSLARTAKFPLTFTVEADD